ncbi:low-density lipoprotein receptor-related protein 2-like [Ylistrum balloti]|uniref:low-density lipoprotein receptor-related protein 2-like n=1 Tax=Ylistrum balloti TaxID=509963 RepID=UPI002905AFFD|nr:low-density lipoprotein receptor-related protein 2-like [Ylistrum balloti]
MQDSHVGVLISRSADFFDSGFFQSIPGTPRDIQSDIDSSLSGEPVSYTLPHDTYETDMTALVNDPFSNSVYFIEKDTRSIYRMDDFDLQFSHPNRTTTNVHAGVSEASRSLAFDWIRKLIYWVDSEHGWICVQPAYTSDHTMFAVVVHSLSYPTAIAVDAREAKMFYFDLRSSSGRISSASLSGDSKSVITHRTLGFVTSLVADPTERRLYVLDNDRMVMESMTYFGNDRRSIRKLAGFNIMSMAVTAEDVCVAEPDSYFVVCFLKLDGSINLFMSYWSNTPTATSYYDRSFLVSDQSDVCKDHQCEHICTANGTSTHACLCKEGYTLNNDNKTCTEKHYLHPAGVLISNGTDICMSEVRSVSGGTLSPICIRGNFSNVLHLAADASTNTVFYYDKAMSDISAHDIVTGATTVLSPAGNVTGLVYDWINKNLFWAEADTGHIRVVNVNDKANAIVFSGITGLGPIAISPHNKTLFWMSEALDGSVSVYAGSLDGMTSNVIVRPEETFYPTAMYADPATGRLFYLDFFTLTAVNPDGGDPVYLFTSVSTYDLVIYKRYSLWISDVDGYLYGTNYLDPGKDTRLHDEEFGRVTALAVFDINLQKQERSVCSQVPNGGCDDICLPSDSGPICKCSFGLNLHTDNKTCVSVPMTNNYLLISDVSNQKLFQVSLADGNNVSLLQSEPYFYATGSAYSPSEGKIYITDAISDTIFSMHPDGSNRTTVVQFAGKTPERLAFDGSTGNVYYSVSDSFSFGSEGYIGVYQPHKKVHKILVEGLEYPRGLAVFPSEGLLFFAEYGTFGSSIEKVWMNGSEREVIVPYSEEVTAPTGLTLDYSSKRIYWVDNYNDDIHSCDFDGNRLTNVLAEPRGYLSDLVIQGDYIYYVGMNLPGVKKAEKSTGVVVSYMDDMAEIGAVETVSVFPGDVQPVNVGCQNNNGECTTFCLPIPNSHACGCEDGVLLLSDGKTCQGEKKECTSIIPFGSLVPDVDCHAIEGYKCRVSCSEGYRRNPAVAFDKMTCTSTGDWEFDINTICEPITCPLIIPHGNLSIGCDRSINAVCSVTCDTDYTPGPSGSLVSCQKTGYWTPDSSTICKPIVRCSPIVQNGMLSADCKVGSVCTIRCNGNYLLNKHVLSVHCRADGTISVNPNTVCEPIKCPDLDNVILESSCLSNAGTECGFTCKDGFRAVYLGRVSCRVDRTWSMASNQLCREADVTSPELQVGSAGVSAGIGYGVLIMVAVILIILAIGYYYYRSRRSSKARFVESPNVKFSGRNEFHNPTAQIDGGGISNPQYDMAGASTGNPYDTMGSASQNPYDNLPETKTMDAPEPNGSSNNPYHKF